MKPVFWNFLARLGFDYFATEAGENLIGMTL
jgi:hypothetical protein